MHTSIHPCSDAHQFINIYKCIVVLIRNAYMHAELHLPVVVIKYGGSEMLTTFNDIIISEHSLTLL